jgi:hypothetical protein
MRPSVLRETLGQDLRFGARVFRRNPGFSTIAVLTLALGIGATAAIFSVVNAVLLRPLPWNEPDRAVMIWSKWTAFEKTWVATGEVMDYRRRSQTLSEVAAWNDGQVNLTGDGDPERVAAGAVTANTFSMLGVSPLFGRTFLAAEDVPNGPSRVVLGHAIWSRRYLGDRSIIGKSIQINGRPYEVIGIMPPGFLLPTDFQNPEPTQLWMPQQLDPASMDHDSHGLYAGRSAETRCNRAAGGRRAAWHRAGDDERGPLSRSDAVRHRRALAHRRGDRLGAPGDLAALWRGRISAADRVRERRESPSRQSRGSAA